MTRATRLRDAEAYPNPGTLLSSEFYAGVRIAAMLTRSEFQVRAAGRNCGRHFRQLRADEEGGVVYAVEFDLVFVPFI